MAGRKPLPTSFLTIVAGLPGTGKTTFAKALAEAIGARHLNTDIIRDELGLRGQYEEKSKQKVYQEMEKRTAKALNARERIVLDGTFYKQNLRASYRQLGRKNGVPVSFFRIEAPPDLVRQRVAQKRPYSEADFKAYLKVKAAWEPIPYEHCTLISGPLEQMLEKALTFLIQSISS